MSKLDSIISDFANQIASQARQSLLAELRTMSMDQVFALAGGKAKAAAAAPAAAAKAAKAAKGAGAAAPVAAAAAAPAKRGPGRPRKDASAVAARPQMKTAAKPAKVAKAPKAAAKPAKVTKVAAAAAPKKAQKSSSGRLARRSVDDIQSTLNQIVAFVQANPGVRSEHITASLGLDKKELPRPIAEGLASGALTKEGQKRATQYYAGGKKRR